MFRAEEEVPEAENEKELDRDDQKNFGKEAGTSAASSGVVHQVLRMFSLEAAFSCLHLNDDARGIPYAGAFRLHLDDMRRNCQTAKNSFWRMLAVLDGSKC